MTFIPTGEAPEFLIMGVTNMRVGNPMSMTVTITAMNPMVLTTRKPIHTIVENPLRVTDIIITKGVVTMRITDIPLTHDCNGDSMAIANMATAMLRMNDHVCLHGCAYIYILVYTCITTNVNDPTAHSDKHVICINMQFGNIIRDKK